MANCINLISEVSLNIFCSWGGTLDFLASKPKTCIYPPDTTMMVLPTNSTIFTFGVAEHVFDGGFQFEGPEMISFYELIQHGDREGIAMVAVAHQVAVGVENEYEF